MAKKAPGRCHRTGMTVMELLAMFPDDAAAERWFEAQRWPGGERYCPDCGSFNTVAVKSRKPMPYRCRDCRAHFSVRKGTVMQGSKLGLQKWAIALYMMTTGLKGTSSMKLYREVGIRQATAWFLMQRIREAFAEGKDKPLFGGPTEADETAIGGKRKNMPRKKRAQLTGRGSVGKTIVAGVKDRPSKRVSAAVVERTDGATLQKFVTDRTAETATVYTDESTAYNGLPRKREAVNHSAGEYVRGDATVNGMEGFWSLFKRGYHGTFHKLSAKHLDRYVQEFTGRNNIRDMDTLDQMAALARRFAGRRLTYPGAHCRQRACLRRKARRMSDTDKPKLSEGRGSIARPSNLSADCRGHTSLHNSRWRSHTPRPGSHPSSGRAPKSGPVAAAQSGRRERYRLRPYIAQSSLSASHWRKR